MGDWFNRQVNGIGADVAIALNVRNHAAGRHEAEYEHGCPACLKRAGDAQRKRYGLDVA